jgi:hypothetical protein
MASYGSNHTHTTRHETEAESEQEQHYRQGRVKRWAMAMAAGGESAVSSGVIFGWPCLVPLLRRSPLFLSACPDPLLPVSATLFYCYSLLLLLSSTLCYSLLLSPTATLFYSLLLSATLFYSLLLYSLLLCCALLPPPHLSLVRSVVDGGLLSVLSKMFG